MKNPELLHTASEQFLGKKEHEIKSTVLQTLEGHLRYVTFIFTKLIISTKLITYTQTISGLSLEL